MVIVVPSIFTPPNVNVDDVGSVYCDDALKFNFPFTLSYVTETFVSVLPDTIEPTTFWISVTVVREPQDTPVPVDFKTDPIVPVLVPSKIPLDVRSRKSPDFNSSNLFVVGFQIKGK